MPASDPYALTATPAAGGPRHLSVITPSDATDLPVVSQWIYIATSGTLHVTTAAGQTLTTPTLAAGWQLMQLSRIWQTGTTATGIMVGW